MTIHFVTRLMILAISFGTSLSLYAHGMNKPGPHGGFIRMPGSFHTEVLELEQKIIVYLLDVNFKNPTNTNSSVTVQFAGKEASQVTCNKEKNYFVCQKPKNNKAQFNELIIKAKRDHQIGKEAKYKLPLKLE